MKCSNTNSLPPAGAIRWNGNPMESDRFITVARKAYEEEMAGRHRMLRLSIATRQRLDHLQAAVVRSKNLTLSPAKLVPGGDIPLQPEREKTMHPPLPGWSSLSGWRGAGGEVNKLLLSSHPNSPHPATEPPLSIRRGARGAERWGLQVAGYRLEAGGWKVKSDLSPAGGGRGWKNRLNQSIKTKSITMGLHEEKEINGMLADLKTQAALNGNNLVVMFELDKQLEPVNGIKNLQQQLRSLLADLDGLVALASGKNTGAEEKEMLTRMIRAEFDDLRKNWYNYEKETLLVEMAGKFGLHELAEEMLNDAPYLRPRLAA